MEFDELLVTTKVDALVRLVKEKGSIELGIAAKLLDVDSESVEEWAHILEEENLIKIDYKLTKSYLSWVAPTPEKIEEETKIFYKEKDDILKEVETIKQELAPKQKELDELRADFTTVYDKIMPEIEKVQQQVASLGKVKTGGPEKLESKFEKLSMFEQKTQELTGSLEELKADLEDMRKDLKEKTPVGSKFKEVDEIKKDLSELGDRLKTVDEKIAAVQKSLPKESGKFDKETLQKSIEPLKKDFTDFKRSTSIMRENITSIKEAFELLGTVDSSIKGRAEKMIGMKKEMEGLLASLKEIQGKSGELAEEVRSQMEAVSGFNESMEFVKMAFSRFPSQKDVLAKMAELDADEKSLETKIASMEKTLSTASLPQISLEELNDLKKELDEKRKLLSQEVNDLFAAVEEESATYSTFQKIKEKAMASIEEYSESIKKMNGELKVVSGDIKKTREEIDAELELMEGKIDKKAFQDISSGVEGIEKKKAVLDDIAESLEALTTAAESMTRKLILLSKEAELLAIRSETAESAPTLERKAVQEKESELKQQLSLSKSEQMEFEKKREELRELVKKLWEQN